MVNPKIMYMLEESAKDQMVVGMGQKEKAYANSPIIKLKIKLCMTTETLKISSILMDQRDCKISGKLTSPTNTPFQINNRLNAKITLKIKKAERSVKRKAAVEAARYKGMVLIEATLKTFWESNKR